MKFPIPSHIKEYFVLIGENNSEFEANGIMKCSCGYDKFEVFSSNERELIKLKCCKCNKELILFDAGKHGWNGFVCKDDYINREEPLAIFSCENCGNQNFLVSVCIFSQGKQDFIDECVTYDDSFSEDDWIDGFEWVRVALSCAQCNHNEDGWIDFETM